MKKLFGIVLFLLLSVAAQAQYRTFDQGKKGGDIIGKDDIRFEVVKTSSSATFYPIGKDGEVLKDLPETIEINVLYLGEQSSQIFNPNLKEGGYTVPLDPEKIIHYYFVHGNIGKTHVEMKEQIVVHGR